MVHDSPQAHPLCTPCGIFQRPRKRHGVAALPTGHRETKTLRESFFLSATCRWLICSLRSPGPFGPKHVPNAPSFPNDPRNRTEQTVLRLFARLAIQPKGIQRPTRDLRSESCFPYCPFLRVLWKLPACSPRILRLACGVLNIDYTLGLFKPSGTCSRAIFFRLLVLRNSQMFTFIATTDGV
jgi:hypothetical protein